MMMNRNRRFGTLPILLALLAGGLVPGRARSAEPRWRRPVALEVAGDETVYVANRRSGSLSVVDLPAREVVGEVAVGERLSDLAIGAKGTLWVVDEARHELVRVSLGAGQPRIEQRLRVAAYPVDLQIARDGRRATIASLWSRRLTIVDLPGTRDERATVAHVLDLPFAPRCQLLVENDTTLIVADAFGGRLGVVDVASGRLAHVREFPGHNIRGLALSASGEMLVIAHQMLNELAHTVRNDVHWGLLMSNDLRWLRLANVLSPDDDLYAGAHMHPLGHAGSATGDPAGLAAASNGTVAVTLGGVDEIAVGREDDFSLQRVRVGRRPTGLAISGGGKFAVVANTLQDALSIVDLENLERVAEISLGPTPEPTLVDRGERQFYNARLSHDGWMSCHSCHTDGHTNSLMNDNFSDASFGAPKRVLSLLGRADTAPFAWDASAKTLEQQIRNSIQNTMQSDEQADEETVLAIAAYLHTLEPPPSIDRAREQFDAAAVQRGRTLFSELECAGCHREPSYTTPETYDVGLDDKLGNTRFNPPSLLGVGQRGPYFHDNRAVTLAEVFQKHQHQLPRGLAAAELADLLAFLRSL